MSTGRSAARTRFAHLSRTTWAAAPGAACGQPDRSGIDVGGVRHVRQRDHAQDVLRRAARRRHHPRHEPHQVRHEDEQPERADQRQEAAAAVPDDIVEQMRNEAQFLNDRAVDQRNVADAAEPLFASLDDKQKTVFIQEMVKLSHERGLD